MADDGFNRTSNNFIATAVTGILFDVPAAAVVVVVVVPPALSVEVGSVGSAVFFSSTDPVAVAAEITVDDGIPTAPGGGGGNLGGTGGGGGGGGGGGATTPVPPPILEEGGLFIVKIIVTI